MSLETWAIDERRGRDAGGEEPLSGTFVERGCSPCLREMWTQHWETKLISWFQLRQEIELSRLSLGFRGVCLLRNKAMFSTMDREPAVGQENNLDGSDQHHLKIFQQL